MKMTRQHFELVAKTLLDTGASNYQILCFAHEFVKLNTEFNLDKFLKASGYDENRKPEMKLV